MEKVEATCTHEHRHVYDDQSHLDFDYASEISWVCLDCGARKKTKLIQCKDLVSKKYEKVVSPELKRSIVGDFTKLKI